MRSGWLGDRGRVPTVLAMALLAFASGAPHAAAQQASQHIFFIDPARSHVEILPGDLEPFTPFSGLSFQLGPLFQSLKVPFAAPGAAGGTGATLPDGSTSDGLRAPLAGQLLVTIDRSAAGVPEFLSVFRRRTVIEVGTSGAWLPGPPSDPTTPADGDVAVAFGDPAAGLGGRGVLRDVILSLEGGEVLRAAGGSRFEFFPSMPARAENGILDFETSLPGLDGRVFLFRDQRAFNQSFENAVLEEVGGGVLELTIPLEFWVTVAPRLLGAGLPMSVDLLLGVHIVASTERPTEALVPAAVSLRSPPVAPIEIASLSQPAFGGSAPIPLLAAVLGLLLLLGWVLVRRPAANRDPERVALLTVALLFVFLVVCPDPASMESEVAETSTGNISGTQEATCTKGGESEGTAPGADLFQSTSLFTDEAECGVMTRPEGAFNGTPMVSSVCDLDNKVESVDPTRCEVDVQARFDYTPGVPGGLPVFAWFEFRTHTLGDGVSATGTASVSCPGGESADLPPNERRQVALNPNGGSCDVTYTGEAQKSSLTSGSAAFAVSFDPLDNDCRSAAQCAPGECCDAQERCVSCPGASCEHDAQAFFYTIDGEIDRSLGCSGCGTVTDGTGCCTEDADCADGLVCAIEPGGLEGQCLTPEERDAPRATALVEGFDEFFSPQEVKNTDPISATASLALPLNAGGTNRGFGEVFASTATSTMGVQVEVERNAPGGGLMAAEGSNSLAFRVTDTLDPNATGDVPVEIQAAWDGFLSIEGGPFAGFPNVGVIVQTPAASFRDGIALDEVSGEVVDQGFQDFTREVFEITDQSSGDETRFHLNVQEFVETALSRNETSRIQISFFAEVGLSPDPLAGSSTGTAAFLDTLTWEVVSLDPDVTVEPILSPEPLAELGLLVGAAAILLEARRRRRGRR